METALATLREAGEVGPEWTAERLAAAVTRGSTRWPKRWPTPN